ncbi:MAG: glycosyltransferase family 2 protein [Hyphomicrobiaceae bacterium]|nr:glycosyltransferase family 2 protein [Hyphomicrobiaceae bacterium]
MSLLDRISVLILTFNEEPNIARTLDALTGLREVVVLDSGSTDATAAIVARYPNARLVVRPFDEHARQWNFGLQDCGLSGEWVLALDADYVVGPDILAEIDALTPSESMAGYAAGFRYVMLGRPLRGALYPPVTVLYRRERARYVQDGHTQRVVVDGQVGRLDGRIDHDDRKPLKRWLASQQRYAELEARQLLAARPDELSRIDRIRRLGWLAPVLVFFYALFAKGLILGGWHGWLYVLQRTAAEVMIALEIVDRRLRSAGGQSASEQASQ